MNMAMVIHKMNKTYIIFVFCASVFIAGAQNIVSISGKVVDSETGLPLPFCNCYLKNSNVGSATGLDGRFDIKSNHDNLRDSLIVQFVGYGKLTLAVSSKGENFGKIALAPRNIELNSVLVKSPPRNWNRTLKTLFDNCIHRAFKCPNVATVYFKDTYGFHNDDNATEVAVNVLFPEKSERRFNRNWLLFGNCGTADERYFVTGLRKTEKGIVMQHPEKLRNGYGMFDCNGLTYLLNNNVYFYKNSVVEKIAANALFRLVKIDTIDGNTLFTIEGQILKHDETTEIMISFDEANNIINSYSLKIICDTPKGQSTETFVFNYRISDNRAIPLFFHHQVVDEDVVNDKTFTSSQEALFSDTQEHNGNEVPGIESKDKNSFEFQGITYDKEFWDNYTIMK